MSPGTIKTGKRQRDPNETTDQGRTLDAKAPKIAPLFGFQANRSYKFLSRRTDGKGLVHFVNGTPAPSAKVAAFDVDGCLIVPKSGNKFPRDAEDWKWWNPTVPTKLRKLEQDGYAVLFISNQAGQPKTQDHFEKKLEILAENLRIPFRVYASLGYNEYRKPSTGSWDRFTEEDNGVAVIDYDKSFYVGDAAGRPADHGAGDRQMAENCGLPFYTPEEFFLGRKPDPNWKYKDEWNPKLFDFGQPLFTPSSLPLIPQGSALSPPPPEVVLFVGFPASGKSTFYKKYFQPAGYVHVNQDNLKSRAACLALVERSLSSSPRKSCVVDNTNPARETRQEFLKVVRRFPGVRVRAFLFSATIDMAKHNSVYRALCERRAGRAVLPEIAFTSYRQRFQKPVLEEGFDEVKTINFRFEGSEAEKSRWKRWLAGVYKQPKKSAR